MDAMVRAAPPPGSANAGDLYVDQQTRTLWLGVDPSVDPAAFLLISDILSTQADIVGAVVESKAYTDAQIATRAPTDHTHTAAEITNFTAAVIAVASSIPSLRFTRGMVMQWSGSLAEIGVGDLAGWALCDGANGTPDLREKFIFGAGHRAVGPNPSAQNWFDTQGGGSHIHSINYTAITHAQMPYHNHGGITGYISHNHYHAWSGVTDAQGNHSHTMANCMSGGKIEPYNGGDGNDFNMQNARATSVNGIHQHNVGGNTSGVSENHYHSIPAEGGNQGHTHDVIGGGGIHEHWAWASQIVDCLPWYALAYIMKL